MSMTVRWLAAILGIAAVLGLAGGARAQDDQAGSVPEQQQPRGEDPAKSEASKTTPARTEKATFGGGCFWCTEAVFERIKGVKSVVSGYAGGGVRRPSYEMVGTGMTGHAEVVQITFDPTVVSYDKLLKVFWAIHDPTTLNQQGPDVGTQYRSIILYHNEQQKAAAQKSFQDLAAAGIYPDPIVTQLAPMTAFYPAERYHQDYYRNHRNAPYCQMMITPKLKKLHLIK